MKHLGHHLKYAAVPLLVAALPGCSLFGTSSQYSATPSPSPSAAYFIDPRSGTSYTVAMPQPLTARGLPTLKVAATTRDTMMLFSPRETMSDEQQALAATPLTEQSENVGARVQFSPYAPQLVASADSRAGVAPLRLDHTFDSITRMVPFAVNRSSLGPVGRKAVAELVPIVKEAKHVHVRGRTDASGDPAVNETLAAQRAATVTRAFVAAGVGRSKITSSQCIDCFVATNSTDEGRQMNRRVDVEMQLPKLRIAQLPPPVYALATPPLTLARNLSSPRQ